MSADPKPPKRIVNPSVIPLDAWPLEHGCPICGRITVDLTRHHVVPRSQGGDDLPENLVWVCGDGTRGCHGVLETHNRDGMSGMVFRRAGELLILYLDTVPAVRAYAERVKWEGWLEAHYMPPSLDPLAREERHRLGGVA